jgi:hypothetical protein
MRFPRGRYNGITFGPDGSIWATTSETVFRWKNGELQEGPKLGIPKDNWAAIQGRARKNMGPQPEPSRQSQTW